MFNTKTYDKIINKLCIEIKRNDPNFTSFTCTIYNWLQMKKLREAIYFNTHLISATIILDNSIEKLAKYRCKEFRQNILNYLNENALKLESNNTFRNTMV